MRTNQILNTASSWLILLAIYFGATSELGAQIPDKFENLQIYPKNISKQELVGDMRTFALGLGVRCSYCHVGDESKPLPEDFASDAKETKKIARIMLRMRNNINQNYLSQIAAHRPSTAKIQCVTCHHEQPKPMTIEEVMLEEVENNGVNAAMAKYRQLREKHYGGFVYNFQDMPLTKVASQLGRSEKLDDALAILKLNLEFHPNSFMTHFGLGQGYSRKGDKKSALEHFNKAYEIQPNPRLKQQIDQLSGK
ncbi:c-type cytochrome [bacterium]|nr:c-type cytochrome [bacterium]